MHTCAKSWQTTIFGVVAVLVPLVMAISHTYDGNPETEPNWGLVLAALPLGAMGVAARDSNKSSEMVGVKGGGK